MKNPRKRARAAAPARGVARSRPWFWLVPLLLAAAASANVVANGLAYDDFWVLAHTREMMSSFASFLTFRGLSFLTHVLDLGLYGERYGFHHLTSLLLHLANTVMAALLARRLTRSDAAALVTAALFAVHPVHVEAVASIGNRKDALAMVSVFGGLLLCLDERNPERGFALGLVVFALGLWAKEVVAIGLVVLVPLALLLVRNEAPAVWTPRRLRTRALAFGAVGVLGTLVFGAGHLSAFEPAAVRLTTEGTCNSYSEVLRETLASVGDNARLLVFPASLSPDYPPHGAHAAGAIALGVLILVASLAAVAVLWRRSPVAAFGFVWVLWLFFPSSNAVPLTRYFIAERYLYGPSFGICLVAGVIVAGLWSAPRVAGRGDPRGLTGAGLALIVLAGIGRTIAGNADWRDEVTLWNAALRAHPGGSGRIYQNLATAQAELGDRTGAIENYRNALRFWPDNAVVGTSLGSALYREGRFSEAAEVLRHAVLSDPSNDVPWAALGSALIACGRPDSAMSAFRRAVTLNPAVAAARVNLGALLADRAAPGEAREFCDDLLRREPGLPIAHVLRGTACLRAGDRGEAERAFREAVRLKPDYLPARVSLAWCLATAPAPGGAEVAEALNLARAASEAVGGGNPLALQCLAVTELAAGDVAAALETAGSLRDRARGIGDATWERRAERLIERLRAGQRIDPDQTALPAVEFLFAPAQNE